MSDVVMIIYPRQCCFVGWHKSGTLMRSFFKNVYFAESLDNNQIYWIDHGVSTRASRQHVISNMCLNNILGSTNKELLAPVRLSRCQYRRLGHSPNVNCMAWNRPF